MSKNSCNCCDNPNCLGLNLNLSCKFCGKDNRDSIITVSYGSGIEVEICKDCFAKSETILSNFVGYSEE